MERKISADSFVTSKNFRNMTIISHVSERYITGALRVNIAYW